VDTITLTDAQAVLLREADNHDGVLYVDPNGDPERRANAQVLASRNLITAGDFRRAGRHRLIAAGHRWLAHARQEAGR
jgi:hypothetical protein